MIFYLSWGLMLRWSKMQLNIFKRRVVEKMGQYNFDDLAYEGVHNILRDYVLGKDKKNFTLLLKQSELNKTYESREVGYGECIMPLHGFLQMGKRLYCEKNKNIFRIGLEELLAAGANVNQIDKTGQTAIFNLFYLFHDDLYVLYDFIDDFIARDAEVNLTDARGNSLLLKILTNIRTVIRQRTDSSVADSWAIEVIQYLLKKTDLSLNFVNKDGESILSRTYMSPNIPQGKMDVSNSLSPNYSERLLGFLKSRGLEMEGYDRWGLSPIEREVKRNNLKEFLRLCAVGVALPPQMDEALMELLFKAAENIVKQR